MQFANCSARTAALQPINFVTPTRVTNNASCNWVNLVQVSSVPVAPPGGEGGSFPPMGGRPKIVICVCAFIVMELRRITRQIHCRAVEQRATLIHRQYNRDWGTSYSRPPIDPYLTSPPVTKSWRRHCSVQFSSSAVNTA